MWAASRIRLRLTENPAEEVWQPGVEQAVLFEMAQAGEDSVDLLACGVQFALAAAVIARVAGVKAWSEVRDERWTLGRFDAMWV